MKYPETASRLKEAMNNIGIRAVDLSAESGVSKSSLSQYMNGTHTPSNVTATALSEVLGVSPVWLMGFDVPKYDEVHRVKYATLCKGFHDLTVHDQDIIMDLINNMLEKQKKKETVTSAS